MKFMSLSSISIWFNISFSSQIEKINYSIIKRFLLVS